MVFLHYLFVEQARVDMSYFDDFIEKRVDPFDETQQEKVLPKITAPE